MIKQDLKKFSSLYMVMCHECCAEPKKEELAIKFSLLQDYHIKDVEQAIIYVLKYRNKTFPQVPTCSELIEIINKFNGVSKNNEELANKECDQILFHLKYEGSQKTPKLFDKITKYLMTKRWPYNSWAKTVKTDELKWFRRDFIKSYVSIAEDQSQQQKLIDCDSKYNVVNFSEILKIKAI